MDDKIIIIPDLSEIAIYGNSLKRASEALLSIPIRTEMTVPPADDPKDKQIGWSITETVGIGVVNPRGLVRFPKCCVCQGTKRISEVDINLKQCDGDGTYPICPKCRRQTRKILRQMDKMDPRELPLSISDPNIFIRIRAANLLEKV
jgi:hypothetical protein